MVCNKPSSISFNSLYVISSLMNIWLRGIKDFDGDKTIAREQTGQKL